MAHAERAALSRAEAMIPTRRDDSSIAHKIKKCKVRQTNSKQSQDTVTLKQTRSADSLGRSYTLLQCPPTRKEFDEDHSRNLSVRAGDRHSLFYTLQ